MSESNIQAHKETKHRKQKQQTAEKDLPSSDPGTINTDYGTVSYDERNKTRSTYRRRQQSIKERMNETLANL